MGDRHPLLHRQALTQQASHLVDGRQLPGLAVFPLGAPALHLAGDVALAFGQVAEADGIDVDGVEVGEHIEEVLGGNRAEGLGQQGSPIHTIENHPVDEGHDVERCSVDLLVGAQAQRWGYGHTRGSHCGDDAVLARHVVGGGQHMTEGRSAEHESGAVGAGDGVGEVGPATGDEVEAEGRHGTLDVGGEPG